MVFFLFDMLFFFFVMPFFDLSPFFFTSQHNCIMFVLFYFVTNLLIEFLSVYPVFLILIFSVFLL